MMISSHIIWQMPRIFVTFVLHNSEGEVVKYKDVVPKDDGNQRSLAYKQEHKRCNRANNLHCSYVRWCHVPEPKPAVVYVTLERI